MDTLIEVEYSSHLLVVRFGVYFSCLEGRVEYSSFDVSLSLSIKLSTSNSTFLIV